MHYIRLVDATASAGQALALRIRERLMHSGGQAPALQGRGMRIVYEFSPYRLVEF